VRLHRSPEATCHALHARSPRLLAAVVVKTRGAGGQGVCHKPEKRIETASREQGFTLGDDSHPPMSGE
jgi:hypothetical protein